MNPEDCKFERFYKLWAFLHSLFNGIGLALAIGLVTLSFLVYAVRLPRFLSFPLIIGYPNWMTLFRLVMLLLLGFFWRFCSPGSIALWIWSDHFIRWNGRFYSPEVFAAKQGRGRTGFGNRCIYGLFAVLDSFPIRIGWLVDPDPGWTALPLSTVLFLGSGRFSIKKGSGNHSGDLFCLTADTLFSFGNDLYKRAGSGFRTYCLVIYSGCYFRSQASDH